MNREEIERLLGGYATNSLTEEERKALFEAALDDQELFDALEREQALRELLDDPASRAQIQRALQNPRSSPSKAPWWRQWWTWSAIAGAVAASVTAFVLVNSERQATPRKPVQTAALEDTVVKPQTSPASAPVTERKRAASSPRATRADAPRRVASQQDSVGDRKQAASVASTNGVVGGFVPPAGTPTAAAPPPPAPGQAPAPEQAQAPRQQAAQQQNPQARNTESQAQAATGSAGRLSIAGFAAAPARPPLRYSLVKLEENGSYAPVDSSSAVREGDEVRLNVQSSAPGYLNLYVQDASGAWQRFFPANGQGIKVNANATYTLPDSPIGVKEDEKLRLILSSEPVVAGDADELAATKARKSMKAKTVEIEPHRAARGTPVIVDITLGAKKE